MRFLCLFVGRSRACGKLDEDSAPCLSCILSSTMKSHTITLCPIHNVHHPLAQYICNVFCSYPQSSSTYLGYQINYHNTPVLAFK